MNMAEKIDNNEPKRWNLTETSQRRTLMGEYDRNIDTFDQKTMTTTNINHELYVFQYFIVFQIIIHLNYF